MELSKIIVVLISVAISFALPGATNGSLSIGSLGGDNIPATALTSTARTITPNNIEEGYVSDRRSDLYPPYPFACDKHCKIPDEETFEAGDVISPSLQILMSDERPVRLRLMGYAIGGVTHTFVSFRVPEEWKGDQCTLFWRTLDPKSQPGDYVRFDRPGQIAAEIFAPSRPFNTMEDDIREQVKPEWSWGMHGVVGDGVYVPFGTFKCDKWAGKTYDLHLHGLGDGVGIAVTMDHMFSPQSLGGAGGMYLQRC